MFSAPHKETMGEMSMRVMKRVCGCFQDCECRGLKSSRVEYVPQSLLISEDGCRDVRKWSGLITGFKDAFLFFDDEFFSLCY